MTDYSLPHPGSLDQTGARARRLRELLGLPVAQLAIDAGVSERDVEALESGDDVSLRAGLAIQRILSGDRVGEDLFTHPRFRSIDEVVEFEERRLGLR